MFLVLLKGTSCLLRNNTNGKMNREIIICIIEKHPPVQCVNFFHPRKTYFLCLFFLIAIQEAKRYTFGYHIHSSCFLALLSLKDSFSASKLLPPTQNYLVGNFDIHLISYQTFCIIEQYLYRNSFSLQSGLSEVLHHLLQIKAQLDMPIRKITPSLQEICMLAAISCAVCKFSAGFPASDITIFGR